MAVIASAISAALARTLTLGSVFDPISTAWAMTWYRSSPSSTLPWTKNPFEPVEKTFAASPDLIRFSTCWVITDIGNSLRARLRHLVQATIWKRDHSCSTEQHPTWSPSTIHTTHAPAPGSDET